MLVPPGSRVYLAVPLPATPVVEGTLTLGQQATPPQADSSTDATVFAPGGINGQTILLDAAALPGAKTYTSTADGRTLQGQVGPFGVLIPQQDSQPVANVVLPPDVARYLAANPALESAASLLAALLARVSSWSQSGSLVCGDICRAVALLLAGYQSATQASNPTVYLQVFLAQLKTQFTDAARLFKARATEMTGTESPLVQAAAQNAMNTVLNASGNGTVVVPSLSQLNPLLGALAQGVLVP